ncbi:MAG: NYN domain-containing protein [Huintestinicola sp.]
MKRTVIGILAHVDSGKTTLSEAMLYCSGEIRRQGRVDNGDAFLDTHELERRRGITIFSKQAVMHIGESTFTLLDTPGHVDFSAEAERTLNVLDYAILVISGTDGVQSHTETLWRLLMRYNVPVFICVNKMDISELSREELMENIRSRLSDNCVNFCCSDEELLESLSLCSEELMNSCLERGEISDDSVISAVKNREVFPCFFLSALKTDGVREFLSSLDRYTAMNEYGNDFGAKVFKLGEDERGGRLAYMKITGGRLNVKDVIDIGGKKEKVNQIRIYSGEKFAPADTVFPGTVCAVTGLTEVHTGDCLGAEKSFRAPVLEPVLTYRAELPQGTDVHEALMNFRKLEEEDPQLHVIWNERLQEIHVQLMGEIQLEILQSIYVHRFGTEITFGHGNIAYKETVSSAVEGVGHYEPLRHYAEVHLILEPLPSGSGLVFGSDCRDDDLDRNWQRLILTHLAEKVHVGVLTGSPITDMKITLTAGRAHPKHTEGGDFRQAVYRAVRNGLMQAESVLLEPWYSFTLEVPSECIGRAITDVQTMCGEFSAPETKGEMSLLSGSAPAVCMQDYQKQVIAYTRGRGRLSCEVKGYFPCHNSSEVIESIGYDCEKDVENSPDSIFCAHGAGFLVKWDKVPEYMHLEATLKEEEPEEEIVTPVRVQRFCARLASDEELMEIFERTYGKINRDPQNAMKTPPKDNPKYKTKPLPKGPEYLLVDGYNIIFAWEELAAAAKDNLDLARSMLANRLCNYQGFRQCELILVFDAYKVKGAHREVEKFHNITIVYTKEAETADMYIEKTSHELSKSRRVRVATSDNLEQMIILGNGAFRVSASEFKLEVEAVEKAIRDFIGQ